LANINGNHEQEGKTTSLPNKNSVNKAYKTFIYAHKSAGKDRLFDFSGKATPQTGTRTAPYHI